MPIKDINNNVIKRGSSLIEPIDFNVLDFQRRVILNGGNVLSVAELLALNVYVKALKQSEVWSQLIAEYPFVGGNGGSGSKESFAVNLISNSYTLTGVNVTNAMCTANGYQGNGTNSYWDTGIKPSLAMSLTSASLSFYSRTNSLGTGSGFIDMGCNASSPAGNQQLIARFASGADNIYWDWAIASGGRIVGNVQNSSGFISGSRTSSVLSILNRNGVQLGSIATNAGNLNNFNIFLGAGNVDGSSFLHTNRQYCMFSIGGGFTQAQETTRYTNQQNLQTSLSRQV
jgi:hypothetical protein